MTALPRLRDELVERLEESQRPRRAPSIAVLFSVCLVVGALVLAASGSERDEVDVPAPAAPAPIVAASPVLPPVTAGSPPRGEIILRAHVPQAATIWEALYFRYRGERCLEVGDQRSIRQYPVTDGGSCSSQPLSDLPEPTSFGVNWAPNTPFVLSGFVRPDVAALEISHRGRSTPVPFTEQRAWLALIARNAADDTTITATLDNGKTHSRSLPSLAP